MVEELAGRNLPFSNPKTCLAKQDREGSYVRGTYTVMVIELSGVEFGLKSYARFQNRTSAQPASSI